MIEFTNATQEDFDNDGDMARSSSAWDGSKYIYRLSYDSVQDQNEFGRYDISNDSWAALTPPTAIWRGWSSASAVYGGKYYVFAGLQGANGSGTFTYVYSTLCYDIATDAWDANVASMPKYLLGTLSASITNIQTTMTVIEDPGLPAAVLDRFGETGYTEFNIQIDTEYMNVEGRAFVSGTTYDYDPVDRNYSISPTQALHLAGANVYLGFNSIRHNAITVGDKIYILGAGQWSIFCYEYDPVLDSWTQLDEVPAGTNQDTTPSVDSAGRIHLFGGNRVDSIEDGTGVFYGGGTGDINQGHQVFDTTLKAWQVLDNVPVAGYSTVSLYEPITDDIIVHFYAETGTLDISQETRRYGVGTDTWFDDVGDAPGTVIGLPGDSLPGAGRSANGRRAFIFTQYAAATVSGFWWRTTPFASIGKTSIRRTQLLTGGVPTGNDDS